jgi:phage FluMu protein Com
VASVRSNKTRLYENTNSDSCQYDINILFSFALQLMGVGGEHGAIMAAFLNLPDPTKFNRQFNVLKNFTFDAMQKVKNSFQDEAVQEEVSETINDNNNPIEQHLLVEELPLHCIQASYDMGWQVRSSGGKYGSATGHGLLVGALTKKVLDSIVYNKKCRMCAKHFARTGAYQNVKNHRCVKNSNFCQPSEHPTLQVWLFS